MTLTKAFTYTIINPFYTADLTDNIFSDYITLAMLDPNRFIQSYKVFRKSRYKDARRTYAPESGNKTKRKKRVFDQYGIVHEIFQKLRKLTSNEMLNPGINELLSRDQKIAIQKLLLPIIEEKKDLLPTLQKFVGNHKKFTLYREVYNAAYALKGELKPLTASDLPSYHPKIILKILLHIFSAQNTCLLTTWSEPYKEEDIKFYESAMTLARSFSFPDLYQDLFTSLEITLLWAQENAMRSGERDLVREKAVEKLRSAINEKPLTVLINLTKIFLSSDDLDCSGRDLSQLILRGIQFHNFNFQNANFGRADLTMAEFFKSDLGGTIIKHANLKDMTVDAPTICSLIDEILGTKTIVSGRWQPTERKKRNLDNLKLLLPHVAENYFQKIQTHISQRANKYKPITADLIRPSVFIKYKKGRKIPSHEFFLVQKMVDDEKEVRHPNGCTLM